MPCVFAQQLILRIEELEAVVLVDAHLHQLVRQAPVVPRLNDHAAVAEEIDHVSLRPRRRVQFDDGDVHAAKSTLDRASEATEPRAHNDNVQPWGARVAPIRGHATKRVLQRRVWPVEGLVGCCVRHTINIASGF